MVKGNIPYYKISDNPHVFMSILDNVLTEKAFDYAKNGYAFLFQWWTTFGRDEGYLNLKKRLEKYKNIDITILACTEADKCNFEKMGYKSIYCSPNAFVDEYLFYPIKTTKKYNAIYNAQIIPYKRIELAKDIKNLGIITFINHNQTNDIEYRDYVLNLIGKDKILNNKRIEPFGVRNLLNQAKCGLILSKEEGGNYATMEYLLCNIPVVTTENIGGRNEFLDNSNSIMVRDNPVDIADAVHNININSYKNIRENTINKMLFHRFNFYNHLENRFGKLIWKYFKFTNKLINWI